jgi:hypothetical protein
VVVAQDALLIDEHVLVLLLSSGIAALSSN